MKATIYFKIEITDNDFDSDEQKELFKTANEESRQEWLKTKAEELKEELEIVLPIFYLEEK